MLAIRANFDGKAFVPQQPVTLPDKFEAIVLVDQTDPAAQARLDAEVRAYYQSLSGSEGEEWAKATAPKPHSAWDED